MQKLESFIANTALENLFGAGVTIIGAVVCIVVLVMAARAK